MRSRTDYIKIKDLKGGYLYHIDARNASYGIWNPERNSFLISRVKFGSNFIFEEHHWDCPSFATAKPLEEIEKSPFDMDNCETEDKLLEYLNKFEGNRG